MVYVLEFNGVDRNIHLVTLHTFDTKAEAKKHIKEFTNKSSNLWTLFQIVKIGEEVLNPYRG